MPDAKLFDLYSDYLISSFGQTTATGLAALLNGSVSHDQITRFLSGPAASSADLWQRVQDHRLHDTEHGGIDSDADLKSYAALLRPLLLQPPCSHGPITNVLVQFGLFASTLR